MTRLCFVSCLLASSGCLDSLRVDRSAGDKLATCGNGLIDEGEDCEPSMEEQPTHCMDNCQRAQIIQVVAGAGHSCVRNEIGRVWCWGSNHVGQLGNGKRSSGAAPHIGTLGNEDRNTPVATIELPAVTQIAAASTLSIGRTADQIWCWGGPFGWPVGASDGTEVSSATPLAAEILDDVISTFSEVEFGRQHACGRTAAGQVWCWGGNHWGALGDGSNEHSPIPVAVEDLPVVQQVAAGKEHSCALDASGGVWCWGQNRFGAIGDGSNVERRNNPVPVVDLANVSRVAAGSTNSCAIAEEGRVWCWGKNEFGQLGDGSQTSSNRPVAVEGILAMEDLALGSLHSCARGAEGEVWCWGRNNHGQLGDGSTNDSNRPVAVVDLPPVQEITVGYFHSCARTAAGGVWCWGLNGGGQLGNGSTDDSSRPVRVLDPE